MDETDRLIVIATQAGLPLVPRPFQDVAELVGLTEAQVMTRLERMRESGALRRIGAIPNHYALGYRADGPYFLFWVRQNYPDHERHIRDKLANWGGNASGVNVANIDNRGNVHPDTMWTHHTVGNVRQRPFAEIWADTSDPVMAGLKQRPRAISGRCGWCRYFDICGGNTRVRAEKASGDLWGEDPGCYLTDQEVIRRRGWFSLPNLTNHWQSLRIGS